MTNDSNRGIHTLLRDQPTVAGIGRGYIGGALNVVGLSPFTSLRTLSADQRAALVTAVRTVLGYSLEQERRHNGGLSDPKLGQRFAVHSRADQPCPRGAVNHCYGSPAILTRTSTASTVRPKAVLSRTADYLDCSASRPAVDLPSNGAGTVTISVFIGKCRFRPSTGSRAPASTPVPPMTMHGAEQDYPLHASTLPPGPTASTPVQNFPDPVAATFPGSGDLLWVWMSK